MDILQTKYIYLSSQDSLDIHPNNKWYDFTVKLSSIIDLHGRWSCALMDIDYENVNHELYVYTDICHYSYVLDGQFPLLRRVYSPVEFINPYFINIIHSQIGSIRIYIRDRKGEIPNISITRLTCTLQFRRLSD